MSTSSFYPLFRKTKLGLGVSHADIFMIWVGGIDFVYRLSRKKKRIRLQLHTHQPMFQHLSDVLSHEIVDVYSITDLPSASKLALSGGGAVFCRASKGEYKEVFRIDRVQQSSFVLNGQIHHNNQLALCWDRFQLHILDNPKGYTSQEITLKSLLRFMEDFPTMHQNLRRWSLLLRRASMRNSWKEILTTRNGYFSLAIQTYEQLFQSQGAHRGTFVSCLSHCGLWCSVPAFAQAARTFQQSAQQWQRMGEVLISFDDPALVEALLLIRLDTWNQEHCARLCRQFEQSNTSIDLAFRLEVLEETLARIIELESRGMEFIAEGLRVMEHPLQSV